MITSVNGERVHDAADVTRSIARVDEGTVTLEYLRDKNPGTAKATIEPRRGPAGATGSLHRSGLRIPRAEVRR